MGKKAEDPSIWAWCMEETVTIHDVHRICETMVQDLTPYIPNCLIEWWRNEVIHKEEITNFWFPTERTFQIYTMFYAYLDRYIINPKCCPKNKSSLFFQVEEYLRERVLDKINHGYEMLEKLLELDPSYFPDDEDASNYSRIEYFFYRHQLRCCSCTHSFDGEGWDIIWALCMKDEIIKEEHIHNEGMWYNTGYKHLYQMVKPLFICYKCMHFNISIVTKPFGEIVNVSDLFNCRAVLVRFTHCTSRTPPCLTCCCVMAIGEKLMRDDSKIEKLRLRSPLETYIQEVLNKTKTVRHIYDTEDEHLNLEQIGILSSGHHTSFLYHIPKMSDLDNLITILKATVDVKIYRKSMTPLL